MAHQEQYAFRAQRSLGLVGGTPDYKIPEEFVPPDATARAYKYTPDGKLFAIVLPTQVRVHNALDMTIVAEIPVPNAIEIGFSPRGTFLSTWERYTKPADENAMHKNHRVWNITTGEEVISFLQKSAEGWDLQYTPSEDKAIRVVLGEIQVYNPLAWSRGIVDRLKVEGLPSVAPSPGQYPALAVFIAEKNGAPATVKMYSLTALTAPPTCSKTFFKADKGVIKWNNLGTQVLVLTSTEVDKTGKNYYGENNLYLLSSAGNFDCRVTLDKEGPIHDFTWSPNSKEFGVVYGFMPAKTVLFDQRVRKIHDFGSNPRNFLSFNPQGRLIALAGFGNLAGKLDIFDRRSLNKVCEIDAPNTSWCEWSSDGRSLLTATLSPRLRVDNGIKIWHCTGPLLHVQMVEELYQASWRPGLPESAPPFGNSLPAAPAPCASVEAYKAGSKPVSVKPAGAYRPPGARGTSTPSIFKREDEGGNGYSAPSSRNASRTDLSGRGPSRATSPLPNGNPQPPAPGRGLRGRVVPGAPPPPEPEAKKPSRRKGKQAEESGKSQDAGPAPSSRPPKAPKETSGPQTSLEGPSRKAAMSPGIRDASGSGLNRAAPPALDLNGTRSSHVAPPTVFTPGTPGTAGLGEGLDPVQKKIRNLNKKLKAIDELKEKVRRGEKMEATQLKKIDGEHEIRSELEGLMAVLSVSA